MKKRNGEKRQATINGLLCNGSSRLATTIMYLKIGIQSYLCIGSGTEMIF